ELAETAAEGDVLRVSDVLIPEEQHRALVECTLDRGERRVVERRGEVDAGDLGAERLRERPDFHRRRVRSHWSSDAGHDRCDGRLWSARSARVKAIATRATAAVCPHS